MKYKNVLVTGAGGLLGGYVTRELAPHAKVSGLDLAPEVAGITYTRGSIEDPVVVATAMAGQDAVVHVAARPNIWSGSGSEIIHTNVTGTWNVLEAAERAGVKRVILTSSDSVVGYTVREGAMIPPSYLPVDAAHPLRPTDPYALSKKLCEEMGRCFVDRGKLEVVVLRPVYVLYPEFECEVKARAADPKGYKGPAAGGRQPAGGGPDVALRRSARSGARLPAGAAGRETGLRSILHLRPHHAGARADGGAFLRPDRQAPRGSERTDLCRERLCAAL